MKKWDREKENNPEIVTVQYSSTKIPILFILIHWDEMKFT